MSSPRVCLVGPTFPYRGGIAHYTTFLARELERRHPTLLISFARQYPGWLFPGESDLDPSMQPLRSPAEYLLSPLDPSSWGRAIERMRAWRPDLVVVPWWVPVWAPAWAFLVRALRKLAPRPRIVSICHNARAHERVLLPASAERAALRLALGEADAFVVHAASEADRLREAFGDPEIRLTPMPTFGALGVTEPAPLPVTLPRDRPILLFCGFVRRYKGLDVLLEALPRVLREEPVHLVIAGEFWDDEARYRDTIDRHGLRDAVTVVPGYVPDEVLIAYLRAANVVVLPYRQASQSAVLQLAFGSGRSAIVTAVGGLPDAVEDGRTGLIVPPNDPQALASAIVTFVRDRLGPRFEANIREREPRFAWQHVVSHLDDLASAVC